MEEMVEAELELLVKVPPKFPENCEYSYSGHTFGYYTPSQSFRIFLGQCCKVSVS